ncbi:MAG: glucosyltransferase domain-containing protein [Bifidobacteriaceae bacterium]|jgi:hypothetical protein|nr:glucosyltransferase domain-containing protein [Bifidobacteriaceae bacterium]
MGGVLCNSKKLREFVKPTLIVFGVYCVAMLSIWRAGFSYSDDLRRAVQGFGWVHEYNRYSSEGFAKLLNANDILLDISPYSQMFAMLLVAIASVIVTYVFCDRTIKYIPLIMSAFIGLFPQTIACWSYKFDAPVMAMSVLVCIVPFLFWNSLSHNNKTQYIKAFAVSFVCLMIMWTSYQPSNGIFLVMALGLVFNDYLKQRNLLQALKKQAVYFSAFLTSGLAFIFLLPAYKGWRKTSVFSPHELIKGVYQNLKRLLSAFLSSLNIEWKVLLVLFFIAFLASLLVFSKRKGIMRVFDMLLGVAFAVVSLFWCVGVQLFMTEFGTFARYLLGAGVVLAIIGITTVREIRMDWKAVFAVPSTVLLYSFLVFALALGNGFADQERYGNFRTELLLNDLSRIYTTKEQVDKTTLHLEGTISYSAVMKHVYEQYPVIDHIFLRSHTGLNSSDSKGYFKLVHYNNRSQKYITKPKLGTFDCDSMKTLLDSYYHTIKSNDKGEVCVILK